MLTEYIDYKLKWREHLSTKFKDYTLYAPPAPASGAIWLSVMGMLSQFEPAGYGSVTDLHRLTEALRVCFPVVDTLKEAFTKTIFYSLHMAKEPLWVIQPMLTEWKRNSETG